MEKEVGDAPVAGLVVHVSGPSEVGWRIIDVWESEEDDNHFREERLNPALRTATRGTPPPRRPFDSFAVRGIEVLSRRGPNA